MMVSDNGTFKPATRDAEAIDRAELIKMMSDIGNKMYIRLSAARFKGRATDDTYLKYVRAWGGIMQGLSVALRDEDLTTLSDRIAILEGKDPDTREKEVVYE